MKQLVFTDKYLSTRPSMILLASTVAVASLAVTSASSEPVNSRDRLKSTAPGEVVTRDNDVGSYLRSHPEHPLNGNWFYRFPDGMANTALSDQQRQIFAFGLHANVPNGAAGDNFIAKMTKKYKKVVVTDPRPESLSLSSFYTVSGDSIRFALKADSQKLGCQPEPGSTELNARVTGNTGFVPEGGEAHMISIPLRQGMKGYAPGAIEFGRSLRARVDAGGLIAANGNNHLEVRAPIELKVSRQIMLAADKHNLKTFRSCINNTYSEPGCITIEGTPDQPGAATGTGAIVLTNNREDCFDHPIGGAQPGGVAGGEPLTTSDIATDLSTPDLPELALGDVGEGGSGFYSEGASTYDTSETNPVDVGKPIGGPGSNPGQGGGNPPVIGKAPEPSAWELMILGIGVSGIALRLGRRPHSGLKP